MIQIKTDEWGLYGSWGPYKLRFGNQKLDLQTVQNQHPSSQIFSLTQIHSDQVLKAQADTHSDTIGDGLWSTGNSNELLLVRTADCLPVLIFDTQSNFMAAIHAGWRGLAQNIVTKCIQAHYPLPKNRASLRLVIGPHIGMDSFEIEKDVMELLLKSCLEPNPALTDYGYQKSSTKFHLNLNALLKAQLKSISIEKSQCTFLNIDTKADPSYFSARREPHQPGRNLSFILKAKST